MTFHPVASCTAFPTQGRQRRCTRSFRCDGDTLRSTNAGAPAELHTTHPTTDSSGVRAPASDHRTLDGIPEIHWQEPYLGHATEAPEGVDAVALTLKCPYGHPDVSHVVLKGRRRDLP